MSDKIVYIDAASYQTEVLDESRPVVVDFYSTECPPCEALATKYDSLAEIYGDDIKFVKIFRQESRELAESLGISSSPTCIFYDRAQQVGDCLTGGIHRADLERNLVALIDQKRAEELAAKKTRSSTECDVLILGAGPAGLTAGIYAGQAKLKTIVVDQGMAGGNVSVTHQVCNYPGFPDPQPGYMLAHYMSEQAKCSGVEFRQAVDVTRLDLDARELEVDGLETIRAKRIVVATGSSPRELGVIGEKEYRGKGISYCATCDAKFYEDKHVVVIGGGNTAIEESLFISKFAAKITVVHQFDHLQANKEAQEKAFADPKIEFVWEHEPREFVAEDGTVRKVVVENLKTGERQTIACDGVFVFAGMKPNMEALEGQFDIDDWGYVVTDDRMRTSRPHIYAAGDIVSKRYRQLTTAVADGTVAAMAIAQEFNEGEPCYSPG